MNNKREHINKLMQSGDFSHAIILIEQLMDSGELDAGIFHMAGQCHRYLNDIQTSIYFHEKAVAIDSKYPSYQLALGIAYQLNEQYQEAHDVLSNLILNNQEWDDLDLAFNSFALTQKKMGLYERAKKNYEQGIKFYLSNTMKSLVNSKDNEILEIKDTTYNLWLEYITESSIYFTQDFDNTIQSMGFPEIYKYQGLYWRVEEENDKKTIFFFPNFLATMRKKIISDPTFFNFIGNIGSVLQESGDTVEAEKYFTEANELLSEYELHNV